VFDPGQGPILLPSGTTGASELSGLAWAGGTAWWTISDDTSAGARAYPLDLTIDAMTGRIVGSPSLSEALVLSSGQDPEGIAFQSPDTLWVSDEVGPAIRGFSTLDGSQTATITIPPVFVTVGTVAGVRPNLGLEALELAPDGTLWTANEEALYSDGPISAFASGSIIRIQRFDSAFQPGGQWGYVTDPLPGDVGLPGRDVETSGVVDLAVLPQGAVLVLERATGAVGFRIRMYLAMLTCATDTSEISNLQIGNFNPVFKILLWEQVFSGPSPHNYEGLSLGPPLEGGRLALVMVADDGGGVPPLQPQQSLYSVFAEESLFSDGFESGDTSAWCSSVENASRLED